MNEYLEIGKVINTHGVRGEVKVLPLTDNPERYNLLKYLYLDNQGKLEKHFIDFVRYDKKFILLKLKGIENLNDAEKLKDRLLKIHRQDAVKLPEGSYFVCDLIGLKVFDINGKELGVIKEVLKTGSNDVYVVNFPKKDLLIPALKTVVKNIDLVEGKMLVDLPEGIMDDEV